MHGFLQTDDSDFDIVLVQEPWFGTVATLRSDTDPDGIPQPGFPTNNKWLTFSPPYPSDVRPKVCIYANRLTIDQTLVINHIPPAPLLSPNSMVIDLLSPVDRGSVQLRIINVYHDKPMSGHSLAHLFSHTLDDLIPTIILGDFNTHSPRWSLPHSTHSSWAPAFHEWMDSNGLETLNPTNEHTWQKRGSRNSIIDLALANESARFIANLSALTVSWPQAASDHAALLINFHPDHTSPPPPPELHGFHIDQDRKEEWYNSFRSFVTDHLMLSATDPLIAAEQLNEAILATCRTHLDKIKSGPPKGALWWNDQCTLNLHMLRSTPPGEARTRASKSFRASVREAKRSWAHDQLFENHKTDNIWRMARVRKGRRSQVLPPLKDAYGSVQSDTLTKASLLKNRFFPEKNNAVDIAVASIGDPHPLPERAWPPISIDEIAEAIKGTNNKSAPGPSGINYKILKWAFDACPEVFVHVFNLSLSNSIHPWKHATVVPVPKPNKPDYSVPKAYRPVSLMECTGKLLEKVIAKRITNDIALYPDILPSNQFGSRPQHNTTDAALALVHRIQATRSSGYHAALILFDISGFFDHIDTGRTRDILEKKGFPSTLVKWVFSFLTDRSASIRLDATTLAPFKVPDGTPQGSPLSPIISAIYTSFLLSLSSTWTHSSLSLYVDDGAILAISATPKSACEKAISKLEQSLRWLDTNGLQADAEKTEIMIFSPSRYRGPKWDTAYTDPSGARHNIRPTSRLRYLGFYLTPTLDWRPHVSIMAMRARSTIRGLSILGNSIRGLDLLHWKQVYLMYVIPILTYGAEVWYTGHRQKHLVNMLQVAQNEGIRKITGVFRTTPTAVSENMIGIAPIKFVLSRSLHSFCNRMSATNPHHILHSILTDDQCTYWRITPPTNLSSLLHNLTPSTYVHPSHSPWAPPNLSFAPHYPPAQSTVLFYVPSTVENSYVIHVASKTHHTYKLLRSFIGTDHVQALGLAIASTLREFPTITSHFVHTQSFEQKLTSSHPHRDSLIFSTIRNAIDSSPLTVYSFPLFHTHAKDSPNPTQRRLWNRQFTASPHQPLPPLPLSPRKQMWQNVKNEYVPIIHPAALACQTPDNGKPVAAIRGAVKAHSRLVTSSIIRIATGHCFDATYSQHFCPIANDPLFCPHTHSRPHLHTRHHILFQCANYAKERRKHLPRPWRLTSILQSEDAAEKLGLFLKASNCSILRPLPKLAPSPTPSPTLTHSSLRSNPLNPEPP